jgi:hypothetical protein
VRPSERELPSHAPGMIRTCDLSLRRAALYPLSYGRALKTNQCSAVENKSLSANAAQWRLRRRIGLYYEARFTIDAHSELRNAMLVAVLETSGKISFIKKN